ncbi:MAG TPA: SDR family oxidoreductase [Thermoflexia bacterium]|jgi:3-oxoacyl-[acyl-carrier protein] reductase|nr:SDR family oxidoreductase [Thermoflexia bacterium]
MDLGLKGKVALVTAASRGLGRAVALQLAEEEASVAICARKEGPLQATAEEIREATGAEVLAIPADVSVPEDVDRLVEAVLDRFGRIDVLVTNAGGPPPGRFLDLTPADWEAAVRLTLMSAVRLCYSVVPAMRKQGGGSIMAMTSISVKQPLPNLLLSNSIRLAVIGLVKTLADELAPDGIRVNAVCPGWTRTERVEQLLQDRAARNGTTPEEEAARITAAIPMGRMGMPEELARAVAFLASPAASYITGVSLLVDGGMYRGVM